MIGLIVLLAIGNMKNYQKILIGLGLGAVVLGFLLPHFSTAPNVLKAPKEKIVSYQIVGASSSAAIAKVVEPTVEYQYVSTEEATATPYYDKSNQSPLTNAEVLPTKRKDGLTVVAFYAQSIFYKSSDKVYNIKTATTTLVEFQAANQVSFLDKIRGFFIDTAVATTTFNVSSTYTPDASGQVCALLVGGGGGGGDGGGPNFGSAGGGGVVTSSCVAVISGTPYPVVVGVGAAACGACGTQTYGQTSTFNGLAARGGYSAIGTAQAGQSGNGNTGGSAVSPGGGGGGGDGGPGQNGSAAKGGDGGLGTTSTFSGLATCLGDGGFGHNSLGDGKRGCNGATNGPGAANTGEGGATDPVGGNPGASGLVLLAFTSSTPAAAKQPVEDQYID